MKLPKLGTAEGSQSYTFVGRDKVGDTETVKLSVSKEMTFDVNLDGGGAKVTGTLSISDSSGTVQFDPRAGRIVTMESEITMSGDLTVDANGTTQTVGSEMTQKTQVKLLDKLPE
jgi:hypothetical protein